MSDTLIHARPLDCCTFENETCTTPKKSGQVRWEQILAVHQKRRIRPAKSGSMLGGYALEGTRKDANVPRRSLIQLDIDTEGSKDKASGQILRVTKPAPALDEIRGGINEFEWCAASSHWHEPERGVNKYRIVILPDRDILPEEYAPILEALDERLGGVTDRNAWQWSQAFYLPSCPQESEAQAFSVHNPGVALPVDAFVERGKAILNQRERATRTPKPAMWVVGNDAGPETPENVARANSALSALDPDMDRTKWRNTCWSLAAHGWNAGYDLARRWSQRGDKWNPAEFDKVWDSYDPDHPDRVGSGTLYFYAQQAGWVGSQAQSTDMPGDIANGRLFAKLFKGKLLFAYPARKWLRWSGTRWTWCEAGEDMAAAKLTADHLLDIATKKLQASPNDPDAKQMMKHAIKTQDENRLLAMINLARSEPGMGIESMSMLDADPWLLNTENGAVNLKVGGLLAHHPEQLLTRQCAAMYLRGAECPTWLRFLDEIFQGDHDLIHYVQRALGYSLTGLVTEEVMFFMFGFGANGKSVFVNAVHAVLNDYAVTAPASMLALQRHDDKGRATPEMARLVGTRFAVANETQSGDRLDEQMVKILVSRERIAARFLHRDYFEFMPTHALWVRGNHKPIIAGDDHGIWRRIHLVPFLRTFTPDEADPFLENKLLEERDGILAWMIDGCLAWQREGLNPPKAVINASNQYRKESDVLGQWLVESCDLGPELRNEQKQVYGNYQRWCHESGCRPMAKAQFTRKLAERGYVEGWAGKARNYLGIRLKT